MRQDRHIALIEEVPGIAEYRWFLWERRGAGMLWKGDSKADGQAWAKKNGKTIDEVEHFEP